VNLLARLFHKHEWSVEENPRKATADRYPLIRTCACGVREILHSRWDGEVENGQGKMVAVSTPEVWVELAKMRAAK